ncbi:uncharacterized protein CLUP02_03971 [Colletotrichum lupini]|uniref:Uncharacterized protein n=1 Tax=Colletotrichum lupini TaxID=145971 RepID=A0A9Q8SJK2_9PEZI|nr:uncharacterized protein CLUP02_03971 [Colletotrichum lupini]UQC78494.1 hypothetical protein CLUP02_03971 [Colletotrichum lupini]
MQHPTRTIVRRNGNDPRPRIKQLIGTNASSPTLKHLPYPSQKAPGGWGKISVRCVETWRRAGGRRPCCCRSSKGKAMQVGEKEDRGLFSPSMVPTIFSPTIWMDPRK